MITPNGRVPLSDNPIADGSATSVSPFADKWFADVQNQRGIAMPQLDAVAADLVGASVDPHFELWAFELCCVQVQRDFRLP